MVEHRTFLEGHLVASIFERIALVFRSKANKALDKYQDPRETLDY